MLTTNEQILNSLRRAIDEAYELDITQLEREVAELEQRVKTRDLIRRKRELEQRLREPYPIQPAWPGYPMWISERRFPGYGCLWEITCND